jgi:alkanesulfonate monooxygenase SsuD/methylene tetrahydromethanopterin reductase-like flavin-dependent oxidoreductase (luciferase family)
MHQMWAAAACTDEEVLAQANADVHLAEALGFDSFMFGEHHFRPDMPFYGRVPVPELMIAGLSATTDTIQLGTGVKILALDAPWRNAEALLLLDLLSEGRAFFCLGQGGSTAVFPPGTTDEQRRALFRERLAQLLGFLRGTKTGDLPALSPVPVRDVTRRLWVAARDDESIEMAAEYGLHFVVGQAEHASVQRTYVDRYLAAGGSGEARGVRVVCVASSDTEAVAAAVPAAETYYSVMSKGKYFQQATERGIIPNSPPASIEEVMARVSFCVGSPETVIRGLQEYQATTGVDRVDVMFHLPDLDPDTIRRSMRLFAAEVRPSFAPSDLEGPAVAPVPVDRR